MECVCVCVCVCVCEGKKLFAYLCKYKNLISKLEETKVKPFVNNMCITRFVFFADPLLIHLLSAFDRLSY